MRKDIGGLPQTKKGTMIKEQRTFFCSVWFLHTPIESLNRLVSMLIKLTTSWNQRVNKDEWQRSGGKKQKHRLDKGESMKWIYPHRKVCSWKSCFILNVSLKVRIAERERKPLDLARRHRFDSSIIPRHSVSTSNAASYLSFHTNPHHHHVGMQDHNHFATISTFIFTHMHTIHFADSFYFTRAASFNESLAWWSVEIWKTMKSAWNIHNFTLSTLSSWRRLSVNGVTGNGWVEKVGAWNMRVCRAGLRVA